MGRPRLRGWEAQGRDGGRVPRSTGYRSIDTCATTIVPPCIGSWARVSDPATCMRFHPYSDKHQADLCSPAGTDTKQFRTPFRMICTVLAQIEMVIRPCPSRCGPDWMGIWGMGRLPGISDSSGISWITWPSCASRAVGAERTSSATRSCAGRNASSCEVMTSVTAPAAATIVLGMLAIAAVGLYFLPSIIATGRHAPHWLTVFLLNLLFGWSFIGWAVAMVMACRPHHRPHAHRAREHSVT